MELHEKTIYFWMDLSFYPDTSVAGAVFNLWCLSQVVNKSFVITMTWIWHWSMQNQQIENKKSSSKKQKPNCKTKTKCIIIRSLGRFAHWTLCIYAFCALNSVTFSTIFNKYFAIRIWFRIARFSFALLKQVHLYYRNFN